MLKFLRARSYGGSNLGTWNFVGGSSGLAAGTIVTDITGLDQVRAEIKTTPYALENSSTMDGFSMGIRNIVITLSADNSIGDIDSVRQRLYRLFPQGEYVELEMEKDSGVKVEADCYVEYVQQPYFSKKMIFQISLISNSPTLRSAQRLINEGTTHREINVTGDITARTPFRIAWDISQTSNYVTLFVGQKTLRLDGPFPAGSTLEISTEIGNKWASQITNGVRKNVTSSLTSGSFQTYIDPSISSVIIRPSVSALRDPVRLSYFAQYSGL